MIFSVQLDNLAVGERKDFTVFYKFQISEEKKPTQI